MKEETHRREEPEVVGEVSDVESLRIHGHWSDEELEGPVDQNQRDKRLCMEV